MSDRTSRWYFGGIAGSAAACCTHPLDLMKVHLQTQEGAKKSMPKLAMNILKTDGIGGFYSGLTASVLRQMTYTITRFAVYETCKKRVSPSNQNSFMTKVVLASVGGACGGLVGTPGDLINVRMQNDVKLPFELRRNYKNAIDGIFRISSEEGVRTLFNGGTTAVCRAILMTVGQLAFYDQVKQLLVQNEIMEDNVPTHLFSSFIAASAATVLTMPVDVMKTKMMNAKHGEYAGLADCFVKTAQSGPTAFFKGLGPAWTRMLPHSVLLFVFVEQLRMNFGYLKPLTAPTQKLTH